MSGLYKNTERLRFRLSQDINEIYGDYCKNAKSLRNNICSILFSSIFSGFVTNMIFTLVSKNRVELNITNASVNLDIVNNPSAIVGFINTEINMSKFFLYAILFVAIFIITYLTINLIFRLYEFYIKSVFPGKRYEKKMSKIITKKFDNIACDSVDVALIFKEKFIENYNRLSKEMSISNRDELLNKIKTSKDCKLITEIETLKKDGFEMMHYLLNASIITGELLQHSDCIRTPNNIIEDAVDIFRIDNIISIINGLVRFLNDNMCILCFNSNYKDFIKFQFDKLNDEIKTTEEHLGRYLRSYSESD